VWGVGGGGVGGGGGGCSKGQTRKRKHLNRELDVMAGLISLSRP